MSDKTTYESLDNRIAPEALTKDHTKGLAVVDGHAVKSQEDYEDPDRLYGMLIARIRKYHPSTDVSLIEKAYKLAVEAHGDQRRKSGEPYIIHPLWVAIILADLEMDKETIAAGMLHDVVEDTKFTEEDIRKEFGAEVALLVDGVTKLGRLSYSSDKLEVQAENLRKMFLAMAKDIRVIIIKLADRLHNMRTLQFMTPAKQKEKAKETMDIYAPIAQRLGISKIKTELDDLALKYSQPEVFYDLVNQINARKTEREEFVEQIVDEVSTHMKNAGIKAEVNGRVKHFFSIYKKMVNQDKTVDQIYDLFAVRIIVESVKDCYAALGVIHEMYTPIPGRFKDYIAMPKPNMYQSLHTTVIGPQGKTFEIQIRTIFSEGWHEIEHDFRYKCLSDWDNNRDLSRTLNGIFATLDNCDWAISSLLTEVAYRHYKAGEWIPMLKNTFRIRILDSDGMDEILKYFDENKSIAKAFFRLEREDFLLWLSDISSRLPLNLKNVVLLANMYSIKDPYLDELTSETMKSIVLNNRQ